ncbi:MAG: phytoene desaturase family protein [Acidimicrobiales bacterium]
MSKNEAMTADGARDFDVIIVGSGMAGLSTASLLAQVGKKRVLVLESHFKLGGFLHGFQRHGYEWDPGVHYLGELSEGSLTRYCMDLVTGSKVQWHKLEHEFEEFVFPEMKLRVPSDPKEYKAVLKGHFPGEAKGLDKYFKDLGRIRLWSQRWFFSKVYSGVLGSLLSVGRKVVETNTKEYLDANFNDPQLKAILTAQWGDYGTPPGSSAMGVHGIVAADFEKGGFYPIGGSQKIIDAAVAKIEEHGGTCLTRHPVSEILIENNKAYGVSVETRQGTEQYFAPIVVSAAGVDTTFGKLVDTDHAQVERARLMESEPGPSATVLFLGIKDDPRNHGFRDTNYWVYRGLDHNVPTDTTSFPPRIDGGYLSFGSLRNPVLDKHTAQIVTFSNHEVWAEYEAKPWKKRGEEYEQMKADYADQLLDFIDERLPGLRDIVEYKELSTPLTVESFTNHPNGQIYGRACTPRRVASKWSIDTSVDKLYITGTDLVCPGINSALMIGVMTAGKLLGPAGVPMVMHAARSTEPASAYEYEATSDSAAQ